MDTIRYMGMTGEITLRRKECDVEWKMDFHSLSKVYGARYESPEFSFKGKSWYFKMLPNGYEYVNRPRGIHLCLLRRSNGPPITVELTFAIKAANGQKVWQTERTEDFMGGSYIDIKQLISTSDFVKWQSQFLVSGSLTLVCTFKRMTSTGSAKCSYCKKNVDAENIAMHEKKCMDRPIKCPECSEVVSLQNWYDHQCRTIAAEDDFRNENITLKKKLEVAESSVDEIEKQRAALEDSLEKHQAELEHLRKKCEDAQLMLEKTMKEKDDIKKEGDAYKSGLEAGLKVLKEDLSDLRTDNISLIMKLEVAKATEEKERAAHKEEMEKLQESLNKHQAGSSSGDNTSASASSDSEEECESKPPESGKFQCQIL